VYNTKYRSLLRGTSEDKRRSAQSGKKTPGVSQKNFGEEVFLLLQNLDFFGLVDILNQ